MVKKIEIVSLSSGVLGEDFVKHEVDLGLKRLQDYGFEVVFAPHSKKGLEYVAAHPEDRAADLIGALKDDSVDMILCAIGGQDTYKLLPYLFENDELQKAVKKKIFLGFSDTTFNHFMLYKCGLDTFYGQAFLPDVAELDNDMLPYTKKYFNQLVTTGRIKDITPSSIWYEERTKWDPSQLGVPKPQHPNKGFMLLQGSATFEGKILGGCIESIYMMLSEEDHKESYELSKKYGLFPPLNDWEDKILLLEPSDGKSEPALFEKMISTIKSTGVFEKVNGVVFGKPLDEVYFDEYKSILLDKLGDTKVPILYNVNIGHATPRCIIPFGVEARVDAKASCISFMY